MLSGSMECLHFLEGLLPILLLLSLLLASLVQYQVNFQLKFILQPFPQGALYGGCAFISIFLVLLIIW